MQPAQPWRLLIPVVNGSGEIIFSMLKNISSKVFWMKPVQTFTAPRFILMSKPAGSSPRMIATPTYRSAIIGLSCTCSARMVQS